MAAVISFICFVVIISVAPRVLASTHWVVTEDGKIQEQVYSIFHMKRPYDLVALMQQEMRAAMVENFMDQLDGQIEDIDSKRDKETDLQEKFYGRDVDCLLAEKPLTEYNLFVSTVATSKELDISLQELCRNSQPVQDPQEPNCTRLTHLDFSRHTFEHLQAMRERKNLSISPDFGLIGVLPNLDDIAAFGHLINKALEQNKTSWILYNFAGYYFRLVGDAYRAIECIRRALHFTPPQFKDVALLNLGNVLHHAQRSEAAAVVISAALDVENENPVLHFTLGNIYAAVADYNKSIESFNAVLKANPDFEAAAQRRHAVLCHSKLDKALGTQYNSLHKTLSELGSLENQLVFCQKQQLKLVQEQASVEVRFSSEIDYAEWKLQLQLQHEVQKIQEQTRATDLSQKTMGSKKKDCSKLQKNGLLTPGCIGNQPVISNVKIKFDHMWNFLFKGMEMQAVRMKEVEKIAMKFKEEMLAKQNKQPVKYHIRSESEKPTSPANNGVNLGASLGECDQLNSLEELQISLPIIFFTDEHDMGIGNILQQIADPLTDDNVPICHSESNNVFDSLWNWIFSNVKLDNTIMLSARNSVLLYITDCCGIVSVEEFGRRIAVAIKQELAPKWFLYHVAASYWYSVGDLKNLTECLMQSKAISPPEHKHITVVPLASLLGFTGLHLAAINFIKYSVDVNVYEPAIVMLLADLYVIAGDLENAMLQYLRVLHESPDNQDALKRALLISCKLPHLQAEPNAGNSKIEDSPVDNRQAEAAVTAAPVWIGAEEEEEGDETNRHCAIKNTENCMEKQQTGIRKQQQRESEQINYSNAFSRLSESAASLGREAQHVHLRLSLGQEIVASPPVEKPQSTDSTTAKVTVEDDALPEILLQVQEQPKFTAPFLCKHLPPTNFKHFTSTWLSVSAKGIVASKLLDTKATVKGPPLQPFCDPHQPSSALTLDHLAGVKHRSRLSYAAESGLREAFQTLGREGEGPEAVETMATRLAQALKKNSTSWVLTTLSALYWRVTGQAEPAVDCLRQSLHFAPRNMRDIPLISLANVFHRAGLYNDALIVANMALEISPGFVVIHFTLANIFAAKGNLDQARAFYESTLTLQSSFEPARDRLRAIYCSSVLN